ncbi:hypothetical protein MON38_12370 [Hymenobacter sp. DH14]|uniref:Uncharacterized protein n=1 Tax=Hymenobacter cyanobacteriorum TaxID=2926463 RepID=A0A9X1VLB4_9BACT|nr:hypothetical protein [Hymenobacter cyanobacteriorum]MCI1188216.1 hypothetical protein [Hymenobacter cyanobacteriorum]
MPSTTLQPLACAQPVTSAIRWALAGLLGLLLALSAGPARAQRWATHPTATAAETQNETAAPSLSRHVHDVQRITGYLADALRLSTAQQMALQHCTVDERAALLLATSDKDARDAQARYLASVRRVLASSQLRSYVLLRQQLEGTLLPLDGLGLAIR